jgi:two-component system OmpR family response regulator
MDAPTAVETQPRVLLVEDYAPMRDGMFAALTMGGYKVLAVEDGTDLVSVLQQFRPDVVILDVYLPNGPDGFALAEVVRAHAGVPVMFLTAADGLQQRLQGFDLGADDYIVKPVAMAELLARTRVALRRAGRLDSPTWEVRDLVIDEASGTVVRAGHVIELVGAEFDLLRTLARTPGQVHSKSQLLSKIWGFDDRESNVVEVYMSSLRRKLEVHGTRVIHTVRGKGYVLRR